MGRFDDVRQGTSLQFSAVRSEIVARRPEEVADALIAVEEAVRGGRWAFGYVAYEAAAGLDPALRVHPTPHEMPLVWFGISDGPDPAPDPLPDGPAAGAAHRVGPWTLEWTAPEHALRVARVREAIARGDTYQCNLTSRMHAGAEGDMLTYYADLVRRQQGGYNGYLDLGRWSVMTASPECFLRWEDRTLTMVPMKGTAPRGETAVEDDALRLGLLTSAKDRAENVMIVDLVRNDMARISETGTVDVRELLTCEGYPTVWQLTSTVTARSRAELSLVDVFGAVFPCGSVTGAPKAATMDLIADLETGPRGVYCGAVGFLAPGPVRRMSFNVAIRTVVVDHDRRSAEYGVGGGVTWSSTAAGEYEEILAKALVLDREPVAGPALTGR